MYIHLWLNVLKFLSLISHFILTFAHCFLVSSTWGFTLTDASEQTHVVIVYLYESVQSSFVSYLHFSVPCLFVDTEGNPQLH